MDPQQELFTAILVALRAEGYDPYDGELPPAGTAYPFVYVGDSTLTDSYTKSAVFGNVTQTIHVYSNAPHKRGTLSSMLLDIKTICRHIEHTTNFGWDVVGVNQQILPDNTTDEPLLHGILEIEYRFS